MDALVILLVVWAVIWLLHTIINAIAKRRQGPAGPWAPPRPTRTPPASGATPAWPPAQGGSVPPPIAGRATRDVAASAPPPPPPSASLNLDAGAFKPVSHAEARQLAGGVSTWSWTFGRRDLIPPISDPRTILIDRAMVGQGIITPEELARIHNIGQKMDEIRPAIASVYAKADRAVADDKEARQRIKQQKKAEAAERKRLHAEAVKQRKASDIIFLGRGVSKGLAHRES